MTFAAPWALFGLLLLPLLWWWARRRMQPLIVPLPSLMFLMEEDEGLHAPRKRVLDWETRVALVALGALIFAAAGPAFERGAPGRRVRIVRPGVPPGPIPAGHDLGQSRHAAALKAILAQLGEQDEYVVVDPTPEAWGRAEGPPASWDAIYATAREGEADVRIVLSDRVPNDPPEDLHFAGVGAPDARNLAWVAATLVQTSEGPLLHAVLRNQGTLATNAIVRWGATARRELTLAAGAHRTLRLPVDIVPGEPMVLSVSTPDTGADERRRDNRVELELRPVRLGYGEALPPAHRALVRDALIAALGPLGVAESVDGPYDFFVGTPTGPVPGARVRLLMEPLAAGAVGRTAPAASLLGPTDPRTTDLRRTGARFVYRAGAARPRDGERALLEVTDADRSWTVLAVGRDGVLRLAPDPLAGAPAPADTAFLPLLCSNLLAGVGAVGLQRSGLEHPDRSRIGAYDQPIDPGLLRGASRGRPADRLALRPPLILLATLLLLLLWWLPGRLEARDLAQAKPRISP